MAIEGLQTFLELNEGNLSSRVRLANTQLVIDVHHLIIWMRRISCSGSDLVSFGRSLRQFFLTMDEYTIQPILIFGGPILCDSEQREAVKSKPRTRHQRDLEQFNCHIKRGEIDEKLIPASQLEKIVSNVAKEAGIRTIQTPYNKIARIANELKCPVLTNASHFIIHDLDHGFVTLDSLKYRQLVLGFRQGRRSRRRLEPAVECSLFTRAKLAEALPDGINSEIMPLLSILLGNDYIKTSTFKNVKQLICGDQYEGSFKVESHKHMPIANLLTWMSGKSLQEALDYILNSVDHQKVNRESLVRRIEFCLAQYKPESSIEFDEELERIYPSRQVDPSLVELGQTPVKMLKRLLEHNDLGSIAFDMIFRKTHYHYPVVLDSDDVGALFTRTFFLEKSMQGWPDKQRIRVKGNNRCIQSRCIECRPDSLALVLIRSQDNTKSYTNGTEPAVYHIDHRVKGGPTVVPIMPMKHLENFGSLHNIDCYSMITMERELKKDMLMACFRFNMDEMSLMMDTLGRALLGPYVEEAALCFLLVNYIGLQTQRPPDSEFVNALLVTIFYYAAVTDNINRQAGILNKAGVKRMLDALRPHSRIKNQMKYNNEDESLDRRITQRIGQLFSAFEAYCLINSLLNYPLDVPRLERYFNSTLVFRLTKLFHLGELTFKSLCADLPTLSDICADIRTRIHCAE